MDRVMLIDALQAAGWLVTIAGQVQIGMRARAGFLTWVLANVVLIALCALMTLWWSIGMYLSNVLVCLWSFRRWYACTPAPAMMCTQPSAPDRQDKGQAVRDWVRGARSLRGRVRRVPLLARSTGTARRPAYRRLTAYRFAKGAS